MNKDLQIAKETVKTEIKALKKLSSSFNQFSQFSIYDVRTSSRYTSLVLAPAKGIP